MYHFLISRFTHRTFHSNVLDSLYFNSRYFSLVSNTNHHADSLTLSTLVNSCGLCPETALKLSQRLKTKKPDGPNAVIQLLRTYGFSDSQLSRIVKKHPFVLLSKPEKTILPKLKFFRSIGFSNSDLPKILIRNTCLLITSLEKNIIPRYEILRSLIRNDDKVVYTIKRASWTFHGDSMFNDSVPNIEVLRKLGVPQRFISHLVSTYPAVAFTNNSRFVQAVNLVKEMEFDPSKSYFVSALRVIVSMDNWESKFKIFEKWGWSRDICLLVFKKCPQYLLISEKTIMKTMNFLVNDVGLTPEDIVRCPVILKRNLEKILVPRCGVVKILKSRGLIKSGLRLSSFVLLSEEKFRERYVTPFEKELPLLLDAYKAQKSD